MKLYRLIAPPWLLSQPNPPKRVLEGLFSDKEIKAYNKQGYNVYFLPNYPSYYEGGTVDGTQIDTFEYVFVDFDLKSQTYTSKDSFLEAIGSIGNDLCPTRVVDSGGGIHCYWRVNDLDSKSYLRLTRRLVRLLNTDEAVGKIFQLMRMCGTLNTKVQNDFKPCEILFEDHTIQYTCEELDKGLPAITPEDEAFCEHHYNQTYNKEVVTNIDDALPPKFGKLLAENHEAKSIWSGDTKDRSKDDYRLGHIMFANSFTKDEALSVLINSAKAMSRAPVHRVSYAQNIVDKIWTYELEPSTKLSSSVEDILKRSGDTLKGVPFRCHKRIDNTEHGFRLGQVIGLVAGSGVGKTAFALNMFLWCLEQNPDYTSFFVPLEQPANEIADRVKTMTKGNPALHSKIQVLSNYDEDGNFRHLSFDQIKDHIEDWQKQTGRKVGMVCIDHIGALAKKNGKDETQDLMTIMHQMKAFAVQTNTLLVMQSQSTREKAGIGDLELNKDAAWGSVFFESYCDFLITLWQPLKRCASDMACPSVTAFKFCKIRHKKPRKDVIQEDVPYFFYFDSDTELMLDMTQDQMTSFNYFLAKATNKRKADRKTELIEYKSVPYDGNEIVSETPDNRLRTRH